MCRSIIQGEAALWSQEEGAPGTEAGPMWTEQQWRHSSELEDGVHRIDSSVCLKALRLQFSKKIPRKEQVDGAPTFLVWVHTQLDMTCPPGQQRS